MRDELLRELLLRTGTDQVESSTHLDEDSIAAIVTREVTSAEFEAIVLHLRSCSRCRKAVNFQLDYDATPDSVADLLTQVGVVDLRRRKRCAGLLMALGRVEYAQRLFEFVVKQVPDDVDAWFGLAQCQQMLEQLEHATASFRRCLDLDPKMTAAGSRLVTLLEQQGLSNEAADVLAQIIASDDLRDESTESVRERQDPLA